MFCGGSNTVIAPSVIHHAIFMKKLAKHGHRMRRVGAEKWSTTADRGDGASVSFEVKYGHLLFINSHHFKLANLNEVPIRQTALLVAVLPYQRANSIYAVNYTVVVKAFTLAGKRKKKSFLFFFNARLG